MCTIELRSFADSGWNRMMSSRRLAFGVYEDGGVLAEAAFDHDQLRHRSRDVLLQAQRLTRELKRQTNCLK
jgi:hypothetical protein